MDYDVIVIGGGPVGLITSKEIAKEGFRVCVLEEHQEIGYPVQCSGLFSVSGLKKLGLDLPEGIIRNTIKGGRFYSPNGRKFEAYSNVERARVVERKMFDKYLAKEAIRAGVEIKLKTKAMNAFVEDKCTVEVNSFGGDLELSSRLLIGVDGVRSNVARWNGLKTPDKIVAAAQVEVIKAEVEQDIAEIYFGREYAPNFYGWILPKGDVYEVGVGVRGPEITPRMYLERFMKEHPIASEKINAKSIVELNMGAFPVGVPNETVSDRVMIVGDAACQTKASTGGGVITGGVCGTIAAKACVRALEEEDFSKEFLKEEYEEKWKEELGFEFEAHAFLRRFFDSMSDAQVDELFKIAIEEGIDRIMIKYRDTDRPSQFVKEFLKNERLLDWTQRILDIGKALEW
ncbi:MAG: geranylgeranyl reductase family protein [Candidatus Hydrothermarchaeales archaeon]